MRTMTSALLVTSALSTVFCASALATEAPTTTRIETRPFYGATVTLEEGVRVFRPLPPHQRIIINPGAKANVSLGFEDNVTTNYGAQSSAAAAAAAASGGASDNGVFFGGFAGRPGNAHHARRRAPGGLPVGAHPNRGHGAAQHGHPSGAHGGSKGGR